MLLLASAVQADDWAAAKLRGSVLQLVDGKWQPLTRGMVVPDSRVVRTMAAGYVTFTRGAETLDLGPDTQIQIFDRSGKKPFTTVKQYFGTVSVEAEVRNVRHFAVDTPFLAAVVKGTRFTVVSGKTQSSVSVQRGHVAVENDLNKSHVLLSVGQSATVDELKTSSISVAGSGKLPPVTGADGKRLITVGVNGIGLAKGHGSSGNGNSGNGNSGHGNSGDSDSGDGNSGNGNSGHGNSGGGDSGNGNSGSGKLAEVNVLGIHLGL